ncbi:MAG: hypothetical protein JSR36_10100 [Proteobacteria bacterium]|nr:hypothetical protein [Pseudomonadota bacterium]
MITIHPGRAGLVVAILLGGWHLAWAVLVAIGWAQPLIDFIFWIHFIQPVYVVENFSIAIAALLIAVTAGIGYALGWAFALLWNRVHT